MARLAAGEPFGVVHPGVAVALVASTDQDQLLAVQEGYGGQPGQVVHHQRRRQVEPAVPGLEPPGQRTRAQRAEVDALGTGPQLLQGESRTAPAEQQVDQESRRGGQPGPALEPGPGAGPTPAALPDPGRGAQRQLAEDLPVVPLVVLLREDRRGEAGRVAHREEVEHQVVVVPLQGGRRRQDDIGVPGRLVDVDVHCGHEVQAAQRPVEGRAVRGRQHRVAGDGQHRPDLPRAGCLDLLAQRRDGQLTRRLGEATDAGAPQVEVTAADQPGADRVDGGVGEHRPAHPVQVAGEDVEAVDRPHAHRAEGVRGHPDPAVHRGPVRAGELAGDPPDLGGGHAAVLLGELRGVRRDGRLDDVETVDVHRRFRPQALLQDDVQHRQQHERVRAGPHEVVLVGDLRGLGAPRVEHHHPASPRPERAEALREVGHGHQRTVRGHRVGAEDQEVRRPVKVGDREEQLVTEHQVRDQLVGELVDRGGAEPVAGPERLDHRHAVGHRAEAVRVGVAQVDPERVGAVLRDDRRQPVGDQVESLVPADLHPLRPVVEPASVVEPSRPGAPDGAAGRDRCRRRRWPRPSGRCVPATGDPRGCRARR